MSPKTAIVETSILVGQAREHLVYAEELSCHVHLAVLTPLRELRERALTAGIDLYPASGFRDFARQLLIWNEKAQGVRPLLDECSKPLGVAQLTPQEIVFAILRWSALPGASRHHWGTDLDVYDRAAIDASYRVQLVPQEYTGDGPFAHLAGWLDEALPASGFFRPYTDASSAMGIEPWHISYAPLADQYVAALTPTVLRDVVAQSGMMYAEVVLAHFDEIYARFVQPSLAVAQT